MTAIINRTLTAGAGMSAVSPGFGATRQRVGDRGIAGVRAVIGGQPTNGDVHGNSRPGCRRLRRRVDRINLAVVGI